MLEIQYLSSLSIINDLNLCLFCLGIGMSPVCRIMYIKYPLLFIFENQEQVSFLIIPMFLLKCVALINTIPDLVVHWLGHWTIGW